MKKQSEVKKLDSKKVSLLLWERITIPMIFPVESSYEGKIAMNDLRNKMILTQDEVKKFKVKTTDGGEVTWSIEAAKKTFDYVLTELEHLQVKTSISVMLTELSKQNKVTDAWIELSAKFDAKPFEQK